LAKVATPGPVASPKNLSQPVATFRKCRKCRKLDKRHKSSKEMTARNQQEHLHKRIEEIRKELFKDWNEYKRSQEILHDTKVEDRMLNMLILFMLKKGILQ
jgi:hypothetical protein